MKQSKTKPLDELTDEQLRALAASRGLVLGQTLPHSQLVALLEGEDEDEEEGQEVSTTTRFASPSQRFSTVSLARILAAQGLSQEAAAVCRRVLARSPGERRARRLLAEVAPEEAQGLDSTAPPAAEPPGPLARLPLPQEYGRSLCFLMSRQARQLFLLWEVALELDQRGAERAGPGAQRVARLHSVWLTGRGVASACRDLTVPERCGERFVNDCQSAAIHRAALGWLTAEGRFFSVCHSGPVRTAPAEPAAPGPGSWHRPGWDLSAEAEAETARALARRLR